MGPRIERLIFVHDGDTAAVGEAIRSCDGLLSFNSEGSGIVMVNRAADGTPSVTVTSAPRTLEIEMVRRSQLRGSMSNATRGEVPCVLAVSAGEAMLVVSSAAVERCNGTASDLRGKIRFGAARVGWTI